MVLTGTVSMEAMGFKTFGFAGGRSDDWEPDLVYWGSEKAFLADERYSGDRQLEKPLAAVQMGLIYVNPEGPNGNPDPLAGREGYPRDLRPHGDERRGDPGAHRRWSHLRQGPWCTRNPAKCVGPAPAAAGIEQQGFGWENKCGRGNAGDTITSGLEGAWSANPVAWTQQYLDNLFTFDWVQTKSPGGGIQWIPANGAGSESRAGRPRSVEAACADHVHDGSGAEVRPGLPEDRA